ncbi:hypothetical protein Tco_1359586 [Tanacetum coccineum]
MAVLQTNPTTQPKPMAAAVNPAVPAAIPTQTNKQTPPAVMIQTKRTRLVQYYKPNRPLGGGFKPGRTLVGWKTPTEHTLGVAVDNKRTLRRVAVVASGGVESRVRESDGGDRIDREMGRIFGVGRKSSPENFSGGCGGGRRLPDIWEGEERVMRECV